MLKLLAPLVMTIAAISPLSAQGTCQWYATTALKQQQDNDRLKCGFTGPTWSFDHKAHLVWCGSVAPDVWRAAAQKREQDIARCAAKAR